VCRSVDDKRPNWIILFNSIHHVLAAEREFKLQGVWCDVVPVPRDLASNCGMAIEYRPCDLEAVHTVLARADVEPQAVYQPWPEGHRDVTMEFQESSRTDEESGDCG